MSAAWALPGYDLQVRIGLGPTGEVWRAREQATGETVAVKRLAAGVEAADLRALHTPYVVRVREVHDSGTARVLVLDHAHGGSLAALLGRRGRLDPGEVVTIGAPLAQALAAAHGCGLRHGAVTAANVLLTGDGMPLLSDLGLTRDPEPDPASDVRMLAALCHQMLAGAPPGDSPGVRLAALRPDAPAALVAAVEAGLVPDPAGRPDAAAFAARLRRAHDPAPVRLTAAPVREVQAVPVPVLSGRRAAQRVVLVPGLLALLLASGVAGWLSGRDVEQPGRALPPRPVPAAAPAGVAWAPVLDRLAAARAAAFAAGDLSGLTAVYATGSAGHVRDRALLQALLDRGLTAHGVRHEVRSVQVLTEGRTAARLRVVDVFGPYELRDARGSLVSRAPARGERAFLVSLAHGTQGWRLVDVQPEREPAGARR